MADEVMSEKKRTLLQKEFAEAEKQMQKYAFSPTKNKLTADEAREKRRLQMLLRSMATRLGSSKSSTDKSVP